MPRPLREIPPFDALSFAGPGAPMKECLHCGLCVDDDAARCPEDGGAVPVSMAGGRILDGRYLLERRLGSGGMGTVYRATHLDLRRAVAVKLVRFRDDRDPSMIERFQLEALALGRLEHPGIVRVTDYGVDSRLRGVPYLVMELLEGKSLLDALREKPLPLARVLEIAEVLAGAIDHAHGKGILHRDLKPANIVLSPDLPGTPPGPAARILDFGLAQFQAPTGRDTPLPPAAALPSSPIAAPSVVAPLTHPDFIVGTPGYMAPEVLAGDRASTRSDLFAFGVVLYEMLTGRHPGSTLDPKGPDPNRPAGPSTLRKALPSEIDEPMLALLALDPAARPATATEAVAALRRGEERAKRRAEEEAARLRIRRLAPPLLAGVVIAAALLGGLAPVAPLEQSLADSRLLLARSRPPDPRILLVSIDDPSLAADPTPLPDRGEEVGDFLLGAFAAGAGTVVFDILAPPQYARSESWNRAILENADRLVLAVQSSESGVVVGPESLGPLATAALGPDRASDLFAWANFEVSPDGAVRTLRSSFRDASAELRPTLAARAAQLFTGANAPLAPAEPFPRIDLSADPSRFEKISWKDAPVLLEKEPGRFRGRLVMVGGEYAGSGDQLYRIPHRGGRRGDWSGLTLQALMTDSALAGYPVRTLDGLAPRLLFALLGALAGAACALVGKGRTRRLVLAGTTVLVFFVASFAGSSRAKLLTPLVVPAMAHVAAAAVIELLRQRPGTASTAGGPHVPA